MAYQPHPCILPLGPSAESLAKKTPAQAMIEFAGMLLATLESKVMIEEQRRALAVVVGGFHGMGMPVPMSDEELKQSRDSIQRYRGIIAAAPLLSELSPEQRDIFLVLFLAGSDVGSAVGQAKDGINSDGKIALLTTFQNPK